jgi:pyruvate dehydrogenase E2 component (dihydrolipoamide acetyltransferase)
MATAVILPKLGQTMEEATVVRWLKKEGDRVEKGDVLLEIQTDKAVLEVESFASGTLLKTVAQPGATIPVLEVIGFIGEPGEELPEIPKSAAPSPKAAPAAPKPPQPRQAAGRPVPASTLPAPVPESPGPAQPTPRTFAISPRAKKLAKDRVIDPTKIAGSGPEGRIIERDVLAYLDQKGYERLLITPTAKKLAADLSIDILSLKGTGPQGKILKADVLKADRQKPRPLSPTRAILASRMVQSAREIPYFLVTVSVDMSDLALLREKMNEERSRRISFNDFILKACACALRSFPIVNAVCLGHTYRMNEDVNIGIAVTLEDGLVVPVITDVDRKSLAEIAAGSSELIEKAKNKKLLPDDLQGATFTVSNMGMLGIHSFTAIIPPGQAAILAVGSILETVVARDGKPVVRKMMNITLSSDHRIIDGATAARFLNEVKTKLEDPASLG